MRGTKAGNLLPHVRVALARAAIAIALVALKYCTFAPKLVGEVLRNLK